MHSFLHDYSSYSIITAYTLPCITDTVQKLLIFCSLIIDVKTLLVTGCLFRMFREGVFSVSVLKVLVKAQVKNIPT